MNPHIMSNLKGEGPMQSVEVLLNSIDKVKNFVNTVSRYEGEFDLVSGRYVIDAKSIMGIFSLDLSQPIRLDVHDDAVAEKVLPALTAFLAKRAVFSYRSLWISREFMSIWHKLPFLPYRGLRLYSVFSCSMARCSSSSCCTSTLSGAPLIKHEASFTLGNAITSRMLSSPLMSIIRRSKP